MANPERGSAVKNALCAILVLWSAAAATTAAAETQYKSVGMPYQEFDVDTKNGMAAYAQAGGRRGVPLLFANGQRVQGFSPAAYDALFANRK